MSWAYVQNRYAAILVSTQLGKWKNERKKNVGYKTSIPISSVIGTKIGIYVSYISQSSILAAICLALHHEPENIATISKPSNSAIMGLFHPHVTNTPRDTFNWDLKQDVGLVFYFIFLLLFSAAALAYTIVRRQSSTFCNDKNVPFAIIPFLCKSTKVKKKTTKSQWWTNLLS